MKKYKKISTISFLLCSLLLCVGIYANENPKNTLVKQPMFEEFSFTVGEEFPLDGILTLPTHTQNPPVVLLVQGSGQTDKNSTLFLNQPFEDLAHGLATNGIASLRYDKRFYSYPQEAEVLESNLTLEDEILDDVSFALKALYKDERVDKIYVLGHSLGGMLTPAIASKHYFVQGIISMAGSPRPLYEISYDQNKEIEENLKENPLSPEDMAVFQKQMEQVEEDIDILRGDFSQFSNDTILLGLPVGYQKSVQEYAGENFLDKVKIPMLILQGTADFQISPEIDYKAYQNTLKNRDNVTFKLYKDLNHLMMETTGVRDISDYYPKNQVDPRVIEDISQFIWHGSNLQNS